MVHFFFTCSFCQVQNQSVWKVCDPLDCKQRPCFSIRKILSCHACQISMGKKFWIPKANLSNWSPTLRNSFHHWRLEVISIHDSPLIFSFPNSNGLHLLIPCHFVARIVLNIISQLIQFKGHLRSNLDDESLAKGLALEWVMSCSKIICMRKPAGFDFKGSGSVE